MAACETPVVASAVGGIPEVVVDGETGLLVAYDPAQAGDPAFVAGFETDFADKVNRLTRDPQTATAMGLAGRQRCIDEFSWAKIAAEFEEAFADLQAERSAPVIWVQEMLPRAAVRQVLTHATLFACPSIYEPLGIVNLEAMACETPVVASAVGGIPEVVVDGETGYLVAYDPAKAGDPEFVAAFEADFAAKVNELTRNPERAREFGLAGRQRCIDEFSWAKIAQETVDVYQAAIASHAARRA